MKKINVLIVDDSAIVRQTLSELLSQDHEINILGTAADPVFAAEKINNYPPDVIILDIEMPRMDGLTFLKKLMSQHPIPVIICSSLAEHGSDVALTALEYGAVEIITKPKLGTKVFFEESKIRIIDVVKAASKVKPRKILIKDRIIQPKHSADVVIPKFSKELKVETTEKLIVIGASAGGTEALKVVLEKMPADCPGILIVQHMPENFTKAFANRLNGYCKISVKEAEDGDSVLRGHALIARGNKHMLLKRSGTKYYVEVKDGPLVSRHRPSVDVLFRSAARYGGKNVVGVIMTGMGDDGAKGMLELKESGAINIAQDEETCVVYGMPAEAVKLGGVDRIVPLDKISDVVMYEIRKLESKLK